MVNSVLRLANSIPRITLTVFILQVTACTHATATAIAEPIRVQYSFASQPWLANLDKCAEKTIVVSELRAIDFQDLQTADMAIRFGPPDNLTTPGFQIGTDDLVVIANSQNPVSQLTDDQVRGIFTGRILTWMAINDTTSPVQVWVFPAGEDVQQVFEQSFLSGGQVTSQARLANNPDEMVYAISNDINAIGLITRSLKTDNTKDVFTAASSMPVLAITQSEPQGLLAQILACMQK